MALCATARTLCVLGLMSIGLAALAAPSGLAIVPTADILPPGELATSVSTVVLPDADDDVTLNVQVGLLPFLEAGYDYSFTQHETVANVKAALPLTKGALAAGIQGLQTDRQWYVAYSSDVEDTDPARIHVGLLGPRDNLSPFLGIEIPWRQAMVMLEGIGGETSLVSLGACLPLTDCLGVTAAGIVGDAGGARWYLDLGYAASF